MAKKKQSEKQEMINAVLQGVPSNVRSDAKKSITYIANALQDEGILDPDVLAYAVATTQLETAGSFRPVTEGYYVDDRYGLERGTTGKSEARNRGYSGGENYFGRGFIQLTHDYNYQKMGERLGMGDKLLRNPDLALNPKMAAKIMAAYFKDRGVADLAKQGNYFGARGPINGTDRATEIAQSAMRYRKKIPFPTQAVADPDYVYKGIVEDEVPSFKDRIKNIFDITVGAQEPAGYRETLEREQRGKEFYTVKQGDTLWGIAEKTLGDGRRWKELGGYSGSPRRLPVGTRLSIPSPPTYSAPMTPRTSAPPMTPRHQPQMTPRTSAPPAPMTPRYQAPTQTRQRYTPTPTPRPTPMVRGSSTQRSTPRSTPAPRIDYSKQMSRVPAPTKNYFTKIYNAFRSIFR